MTGLAFQVEKKTDNGVLRDDLVIKLVCLYDDLGFNWCELMHELKS